MVSFARAAAVEAGKANVQTDRIILICSHGVRSELEKDRQRPEQGRVELNQGVLSSRNTGCSPLDGQLVLPLAA